MSNEKAEATKILSDRMSELAKKWKADPSPIFGHRTCIMSRGNKSIGIACISPFTFPYLTIHDFLAIQSITNSFHLPVFIEFSDGSSLKLEHDSFSGDALKAYDLKASNGITFVSMAEG